MLRSTLLAGCAAVGLLVPTMGQAQTADAAQTSAADESPVAEGEILVTARRKEEALTAVPASITAMSSAAIQQQNIQSFSDYATKLPNVSFQYGATQTAETTGISNGRQTVIRGVAGGGTTAYYIDDTPIPSTVSPLASDLERIEVLKGPQGTLFGSSSMGGNVRFITKRVSLTENSANMMAGVGSTRLGKGPDYNGEISANFVVSPDNVAIRASAQYLHESGFISRRFPDGNGGFTTKRGDGDSDTFAGSIALRARLSDRLELNASIMGQKTDMSGWPAAYTSLPSNQPVSYTQDRWNDIQGGATDKWFLGAVTLNYKADAFSIVSSTSWFKRNSNNTEDGSEANVQFLEAFAPLFGFNLDLGTPPLIAQNFTSNARFTHETRVNFDNIGIPGLSGIVGFFYQNDRNSYNQPAMSVPGTLDFFTNAFGFPTEVFVKASTSRKEESKGLFGELYYEILPGLTATVGLRQYWLDQTFYPDDFDGPFFAPLAQGLRHNKEKGIVPKYVLSYKIGDNGNVYVSASKGFRPGGANAALFPSCADSAKDLGFDSLDELKSYKSDSLWNYEIGAKSRFLNGRLNVSAAVFQMDWKGIQQPVPLDSTTCGFTPLTNAGKARIRGGELEVSGRPIADVDFTLQASLGYLNGKLTDPGLSGQAVGAELLYTPKWSASVSGYYKTQLTSSLDGFIQADYSYTGSVRLPDYAGGPPTSRRPAINMVNARAGISFGKSELSFFVKNLLDKRLNLGDIYSLTLTRQDGTNGFNRLPLAAVSRPRQIGAQFRTSF